MSGKVLWPHLVGILWFIFVFLTGLSLIAACWLATFDILTWLEVLWWFLVFVLVTVIFGGILEAVASTFQKRLDG